MRGKKIDTDFVANFITQCVVLGFSKNDDIYQEAKKQILEIDQKIIEIEELKKKRSKLCDVIITLGEKKTDYSIDKTILSFYGISNLPSAYELCLSLQELKNLDVKNLSQYNSLTIKQMLSVGILNKDGKSIIPGDFFNLFLNFYSENYGKA